MTNQAIADQLAAVFRSFDANDVSALSKSIADDVELRLGNTPTIIGKAGFIGAVQAFHDSVSAVHHEILHVYVDRDIAAVEFDVHYTRHDGNVVVLPCCNVFRLRDGVISEYRSYMDATPVYAEGEAAR